MLIPHLVLLSLHPLPLSFSSLSLPLSLPVCLSVCLSLFGLNEPLKNHSYLPTHSAALLSFSPPPPPPTILSLDRFCLNRLKIISADIYIGTLCRYLVIWSSNGNKKEIKKPLWSQQKHDILGCCFVSLFVMGGGGGELYWYNRKGGFLTYCDTVGGTEGRNLFFMPRSQPQWLYRARVRHTVDIYTVPD